MVKNRVYFYDEDKKKVFYDLSNYFDSGLIGYIYRLDDDTCLKWMSDSYCCSLDTLKIIRDLKLENFYEIYKILYNSDGQYAGYTMKYYQKEDIDILTMPTFYTLDNLYKLANSFKKLGSKSILAYDCHSGNVIMDKNNITVIDADIFMQDRSMTRDDLDIENYFTLLCLFINIYLDAFKVHGYVLNSDRYIVGSLFDEHNSLDEISKKLTRYKYPIDYVNSVRKG